MSSGAKKGLIEPATVLTARFLRTRIKGGVSVSTLVVVRWAHSLFSQFVEHLIREARDRGTQTISSAENLRNIWIYLRPNIYVRFSADHHSSSGRQRRVTSKLGCCDLSEKGLFSEASPRLAKRRRKECFLVGPVSLGRRRNINRSRRRQVLYAKGGKSSHRSLLRKYSFRDE